MGVLDLTGGVAINPKAGVDVDPTGVEVDLVSVAFNPVARVEVDPVGVELGPATGVKVVTAGCSNENK